MVVCLYVDDLIIASDSLNMIDQLKNSMKKEFEMTDLGNLHYFLGMEVHQENGDIFISQQRYASNLLDKFNMKQCNAISTPMEYGQRLSKDDQEEEVNENIYRSLVGSLMYLTNTRPDIMFAICKVSRFMERPKRSHWEAAKRILRYIKGTVTEGITYSKGSKGKLVGFSDSDYAGNVDDSKSTSGYVFNLGSGAIAWQSKKQKVVALSSTEAEYIALSMAGCQALWMKGILNDLCFNMDCPPTVYCDNKSTICLAKDPVYHGKSKHIRVKYHFIRDLIKNDEVEVCFCSTKDQVADILTKALQPKDFYHFKELLHINPLAPLDKVCVLSCGISTGLGATLNVAKPKKGSSVAVFGLGAVGLAAAEGARISGASRIIGVDLNANRFELAKKFGVTEFVNPKDYKKPVQEVIAEMTNGGVDRSVECTGHVDAMISAFECVHDGWGVAVLVGVPHKDAVFKTSPMNLLNERTLKGTFFGNYKPRSDIPSVVEKYMNKELEVEKFITHEVPFSEINKAFDLMLKGEGLRCIIRMDA
ncbi:putative alcohol dehydrogenase [Helianthus annuus]|nr:putative alcohol dehydrogenase [Helianthus annuus]KAJ0924358.1 putative alcohol dehydrogenase [Helianthus annuus]